MAHSEQTLQDKLWCMLSGEETAGTDCMVHSEQTLQNKQWRMLSGEERDCGDRLHGAF